jgi:predicted CXXCH cytochrome family protein
MLRIIIAFFLFAVFVLPIHADTDNCITCHQSWEDDDGPSFKFSRDIHSQKDLGCADCHGGDPTLDDMDEVRDSKNYRGVPDYLEVPDFCARCHSNAKYMHDHNPTLPVDQLAKYKTSVHGQRLFGKKDKKVANCVSCHGVHNIGDEKMPHSSTYPTNIPKTCAHCHADSAYMAGYNIPTNQYADYKVSVHGIALLENNDLGAPACNDCHGNHGAAPPGVNSLAAVCGVCHALEAKLFDASPHKAAYEEYDFPMCEICHSNHKILKPVDSMIGSSESAVCTQCHSPDDGTIALKTADSILTLIRDLVKANDTATVVMDDAKAKGMMTVNEEFLLKDVNQSLIQARTMVHSFNVDSVVPKAEVGIAKADTVKINSLKLIGEYHFRRKGLAVATLIITFLVLMLYRRIRKLEH